MNERMTTKGAAQRMDAIKLAKASKWDELKALVDAEPLTAQQLDSYGMLPLHWACTEPHSIHESVLMSLLKAYPQGARVMNTAEMVPLQIAIKAQAKIEWLQALLASYPDAVLKKAPSGENAVQLARKSNLPPRSIKLLEEMYHHVCEKAGYAHDQLSFGDDSAESQEEVYPPEKASITGGLRPVDPSITTAEGLQRYVSETRSSGGLKSATNSRRSSNSDRQTTASHKIRAFSDNDFVVGMQSESMIRGTTTESTFLRQVSAGSTATNYSVAKPLPYQTSTKLSSRTIVSLPPRWTNAPNCHICSQKFGPFKKRHHCRNCGQSICSDHSAREKLRLPHYGLNDRHRVCVVCFDTLRTADRELMQPSVTTQRPTALGQQLPPAAVPLRRSDEAPSARATHMSARMGSQSGNGYNLERHVSAPARPTLDTDYHGIHEQVASLQRQVSQLMEEKEMAESQLRMQAELLGEALGTDPERLTSALSRRDRLNSYPVKLPSNSSASGFPSLENAGVSASAAAREVDIDHSRARGPNVTAPPPVPVAVPPTLNHFNVMQHRHLNDAMGNMSFAESTYSDLEDRPTDAFDEYEDRVGAHEELIQEEEEEDEEESALPEVDVLVNLGLSLLEKGSSSAAVQAFTRAVEICPDDPTLYSYLGKAQYADDNLDEAVVAIEKSLALEPSAANSTLLGKILFEKGDHERAIEAYQKSLDIQKARE